MSGTTHGNQRARSTTRPRSPEGAPGRESARRARCGTRSQRQVAARDHEVGFAHAQDLDELACVLKSAEVRAVVDDVLRERAGEAWNDLELFERGAVEIGPDEDGCAGGALRERDLDLLAVLKAAGQVGKARDVGFHGQAAGRGYGAGARTKTLPVNGLACNRLVPGEGFEPSVEDPKSSALPLGHPGKVAWIPMVARRRTALPGEP